MGSSSRIAGEEKNALLFTERLIPFLDNAIKDIRLAFRLVVEARDQALEIVKVWKTPIRSPADAVLARLKARDETVKFNKLLSELIKTLEDTDHAIQIMNKCINPLKAIEAYTKRLAQELSHFNSRLVQGQRLSEAEILSLVRRIIFGIESNIRKCESIKELLTIFLRKIKFVPQEPAAFHLELAEEVAAELGQIQTQFATLHQSMEAIMAEVKRVAGLETTVLKLGFRKG